MYETSMGPSFGVLGPRCEIVKRMVDEATQQGEFVGPVIGPIGLYCKIQPGKEDLALSAESAIGDRVFDRFVVHNDADRKRFSQIRRDAGCQQDCELFQQFQHSRYEVPPPPQGVETFATVVSIQNDLIFNCLVDNARIEETIIS